MSILAGVGTRFAPKTQDLQLTLQSKHLVFQRHASSVLCLQLLHCLSQLMDLVGPTILMSDLA
jgi:hypothetical protein